MLARAARPDETRLLKTALLRWRGPRLPNSVLARLGISPGMFDPHQLAIGTAVELEHTTDPRMAMEIAMIHLLEDRRYYAKLAVME